jgi:transmembrane sensor
MNSREDIIARAVAWHYQSQGDDMDWAAFTQWLEADASHAAAFDEIALLDAALADLPIRSQHAVPIAANDTQGDGAADKIRWKRWAGTAVAASLLAMVGLPMLRDEPPAVYRSHGQSLTVTLEDGSRVLLAPASELTIAGDEGESLTLAGGGYFDIRHDPSRELTIAAGPLSISDIGTKFDVQAANDVVRVAVSEGRVAVRSPRLAQRVELAAGRQLQFDDASGLSVTSAVETANVGSWRAGQITYSEAPLSLVSADLRRYASVELEVPEDVGRRLFSGTLSIDDGNTAVRDLSQLMGLELVRGRSGYRLHDPAN